MEAWYPSLPSLPSLTSDNTTIVESPVASRAELSYPRSRFLEIESSTPPRVLQDNRRHNTQTTGHLDSLIERHRQSQIDAKYSQLELDRVKLQNASLERETLRLRKQLEHNELRHSVSLERARKEERALIMAELEIDIKLNQESFNKASSSRSAYFQDSHVPRPSPRYSSKPQSLDSDTEFETGAPPENTPAAKTGRHLLRGVTQRESLIPPPLPAIRPSLSAEHVTRHGQHGQPSSVAHKRLSLQIPSSQPMSQEYAQVPRVKVKLFPHRRPPIPSFSSPSSGHTAPMSLRMTSASDSSHHVTESPLSTHRQPLQAVPEYPSSSPLSSSPHSEPNLNQYSYQTLPRPSHDSPLPRSHQPAQSTLSRRSRTPFQNLPGARSAHSAPGCQPRLSNGSENEKATDEVQSKRRKESFIVGSLAPARVAGDRKANSSKHQGVLQTQPLVSIRTLVQNGPTLNKSPSATRPTSSDHNAGNQVQSHKGHRITHKAASDDDPFISDPQLTESPTRPSPNFSTIANPADGPTANDLWSRSRYATDSLYDRRITPPLQFFNQSVRTPMVSSRRALSSMKLGDFPSSLQSENKPHDLQREPYIESRSYQTRSPTSASMIRQYSTTSKEGPNASIQLHRSHQVNEGYRRDFLSPDQRLYTQSHHHRRTLPPQSLSQRQPDDTTTLSFVSMEIRPSDSISHRGSASSDSSLSNPSSATEVNVPATYVSFPSRPSASILPTLPSDLDSLSLFSEADTSTSSFAIPRSGLSDATHFMRMSPMPSLASLTPSPLSGSALALTGEGAGVNDGSFADESGSADAEYETTTRVNTWRVTSSVGSRQRAVDDSLESISMDKSNMQEQQQQIISPKFDQDARRVLNPREYGQLVENIEMYDEGRMGSGMLIARAEILFEGADVDQRERTERMNVFDRLVELVVELEGEMLADASG